MSGLAHVRIGGVAGALVLLALPATARAQRPSGGEKPAAKKAAAVRDHQHDFDFEFGTWKIHLRRLVDPLTGSNAWVELDGVSTVRKVWGGRANLGELDVGNATTRILGMSLRLYNPESGQWSIYWSNSRDGSLGPAMIGRFENGRGEFYDQEMFRGSPVYVRFIFSDVTPTSFRLEQAFSADGGRTWEPNWIASFTRQRERRGTG